MEVFGADRVLFSVDYPFSDNVESAAFLKRRTDQLSRKGEDRPPQLRAPSKAVARVLPECAAQSLYPTPAAQVLHDAQNLVVDLV